MSGRKNSLRVYQLISSASTASNITSPPVNIEFLDNIGFQVNVTGSPTGTIVPQVSADYSQDNQGNVLNPGNWISMLNPDGTPVVITFTAGSPTNGYFDLTQLSTPWIRLMYTGSGTGTLSAFVTAKML